jgi:hypothetical protein
MSYSNGPTIVTNGLVLALDAGDRNSYVSGSTTWRDLVGSNNGTLQNSPGFNTGSLGSIVFDGTNDYIDCGNILNYTSENFTFSYWAYFNSLTTNQVGQGPVVLFKGAFQSSGYYNQIATDGKVVFVTNQGGAYQASETFPGSININTWYNLTHIRNGSSVNTYINAIDSTLVAATHINPQSSSTNFTIALYPFSIYGNFRLSQFLNYNRALTSQEILQNYNATKGRFGL